MDMEMVMENKLWHWSKDRSIRGYSLMIGGVKLAWVYKTPGRKGWFLYGNLDSIVTGPYDTMKIAKEIGEDATLAYLENMLRDH